MQRIIAATSAILKQPVKGIGLVQVAKAKRGMELECDNVRP